MHICTSACGSATAVTEMHVFYWIFLPYL